MIEETKPDVVLLDLRMPRLDGVGVLQRLRERGISPTLILTTFDDDTMLFDAVRAGAKGWLLKDVSLERLTGAIRTLAEGGTCIEPVITERIVRALERSERRLRLGGAARAAHRPREDDPAAPRRRLQQQGDLASCSNISDGTVKNHISKLLAKLGVRDRTRAVLKAIDLGVI